MSNENKQHENKKVQQPTTTPAAQVELSEEELQQVTGGFDPKPEPPGRSSPDGIILPY